MLFNIWTTFFNFYLSAATAAWRRRDDRINTYTLNFSMKNDPCGISNDYLASLKLELPSAVWTAEPCLDYVFSQDPGRTEDRLAMKCPLDFSDPMLNHVTYPSQFDLVYLGLRERD